MVKLLAAAHAVLASMKTMSPPTGVQTSPTETPGFLTRSSTSFSSAELRDAERLANHFRRDDQLVRLAFGDAPRLLAHERGDFAFEIAHARFPRVAVDHLAQRLFGELNLLADLDPVLFRLLAESGTCFAMWIFSSSV